MRSHVALLPEPLLRLCRPPATFPAHMIGQPLDPRLCDDPKMESSRDKKPIPKLLRWFMWLFAVLLIARFLPLAIQTGDVLAWVTTTGAVLMLVSLVVMSLEFRKRDKTPS